MDVSLRGVEKKKRERKGKEKKRSESKKGTVEK